jgi:hypothetical protein
MLPVLFDLIGTVENNRWFTLPVVFNCSEVVENHRQKKILNLSLYSKTRPGTVTGGRQTHRAELRLLKSV